MTAYEAVKLAGANRSRLWFVIDGTGHRVGRLASVIATVLQGKHKPFYHPAIEECGDHVIVLNADKVTFSGDKEKQKVYRHHTGFKGGLKEIPVRRFRERHPERVLQHAVHGMLPKNRSRHVREARLVLLTGDEHPHHSQVVSNPYRLATVSGASKPSALPSVSGFFVSLTDSDEAIQIEAKPHVPAKLRATLAERARKSALHKQLKAYLLGRGERPDFLPQSPTAAGKQ